MALILLIIIANTWSSNSIEYGCYNDESCTLSSENNNYSPADELFCTSMVTTCNILCISPNGCHSITIYSSAQYTNIICAETSSCKNTTIRIGDTLIYPLSLQSQHFTNNNPTNTNIECRDQESCSLLNVHFHGNSNDQCTISSTDSNAFYNGYFDCNIHETTHNQNNTTQCNLYCPNVYQNECLYATMDCDDKRHCQCNGDGCDHQQIHINLKTMSTTTVSSLAVYTKQHRNEKLKIKNKKLTK